MQGRRFRVILQEEVGNLVVRAFLNPWSRYINIEGKHFERVAISPTFRPTYTLSPYPVTVTSCHTPLKTPYPKPVFQLESKSAFRIYKASDCAR